jgi:3-hydroxyisobutyrate dehydrogenase
VDESGQRPRHCATSKVPVMNFGFVGLGNIGKPIARDLIVAGNDVVVYDLRPEPVTDLSSLGARAGASPAEVAQRADIIGVCVRDDSDVHEVFDGRNGILAAARPGLLVAIHSTVRIDTVRRIAERAAEKGVRIVDAPVSRSATGPATKAVVFMVGGEPDDVAQVRPFLEPAALKIVVAGRLGAGMALKICNNLLSYLILVCATDAIGLAEAAGLEVQLLADVTSSNGVAGPNLTAILMRRTGRSAQMNAFIPALDSLIGLGEKDLDCALEVGRDLGVQLPAVAMARHNIRRALEQNFATV